LRCVQRSVNHEIAATESPRTGQEFVWDYPRPAAAERTQRRIRAVVAGVVLADSTRAIRVLETSHPPTYYLPPADARMDLLVPAAGSSVCEWKGHALYHDARIESKTIQRVAWSYPDPTPAFDALRDDLAFYLPALDAAYVDDERAQPQPGGFYGGWITSELAGPFKGVPGSSGW
jgi:uncharacterized protein (DUF427 family)